MTLKQRQMAYRDCLEKYTFLPILILLDDLIAIEDYEECAILRDCLQEYYIKQKMFDYPVWYGLEATDLYIADIDKKGFDGAKSLKNIPIHLKAIKRNLKLSC